jgi:two-component system LytT family response regulator
LERAERRIAEVRAATAKLETADVSPVERYLERLVIPERGRRVVVPVPEIDWIEGDTYYVRVHAHGRVHLLRERLSRLEAQLDPAMFHRTHRSAIVRLDLIREVISESQYSFTAVLATGARAPVSRERVKELDQRLTIRRRHRANPSAGA